MQENLQTEYQSIPNMDVLTVSGNRFYAHVAGKTNGAHLEYVKRLKDLGHTEVFSPEESDYIVVFCPIASRVGTDVGEALEGIRDGTPAILVVMHHTFNPNHVVAESRRQVANPNVRLTVDCLFHEGKFLRCNLNKDAWYGIQRALRVSHYPAPVANGFLCRWIKDHPRVAVAVAVFVFILLVVVVIIAVSMT